MTEGEVGESTGASAGEAEASSFSISTGEAEVSSSIITICEVGEGAAVDKAGATSEG
jgi:hypothetical protein